MPPVGSGLLLWAAPPQFIAGCFANCRSRHRSSKIDFNPVQQSYDRVSALCNSSHTANSLGSFHSSLKASNARSAWRWTEQFKNQTGLSALACERIGLSGLTTAPFLALFTAPPSQRATTSRYCALRRCFRSAALIAPSAQFLSCQEQDSQLSSLSCPEKKPCQTTFQLPCRPTTMPASPIALTIFLEPPVS